MRIKRRDITGQLITVEVAADYVLQDGEQVEAADEPQRTISREEHEAMLTRVRTEEKSKLHSTIERNKEALTAAQQERETLSQRLTELEARNAERELEGLKPNERQAVELRMLQERLAETERNAAQREQALQARIRATELTAYRERALRAVGGSIIPELVRGSTEEEIDASTDAAMNAYKEIQARIRKDMEAEFVSRANSSVSTPVAVVAPANPAYQQPVSSSAANGLPSVASPEPVADASFSPLNLGEFTSEEAVRTGRWGGELRQQVLAQLKGQQRQSGPVQLGSAPRFLAPQPASLPMPNGVMQPQGNPTGPVSHPQVAQPSAPQVAPGGDARAAAMAAVARTHAGGNPVMAANPGAATALAQARATGATPSVAYASRFAPSPSDGQ